MKIDIKKLENYWYYYKAHTIIGTLTILLTLIVVIFSCISDPVPDVYISYINKNLTPLKSVSDLEKRLSMQIFDVNNDGLKKAAILDVTNSFKAGVVTQSGQADIHLCNRTRIEKVAKMGLLEPLDDLILKYKINIENISLVKLSPDGTDKEHIYAISLANSSFVNEYNVDFSDTYFSVRRLSNIKKDINKRENLRESASSVLKELLR